MGQHRIRLDDSEVDLIVSALLARRAGASSATKVFIDRLVTRLAQGLPGNPEWRYNGTVGYPSLAERRIVTS